MVHLLRDRTTKSIAPITAATTITKRSAVGGIGVEDVIVMGLTLTVMLGIDMLTVGGGMLIVVVVRLVVAVVVMGVVVCVALVMELVVGATTFIVRSFSLVLPEASTA